MCIIPANDTNLIVAAWTKLTVLFSVKIDRSIKWTKKKDLNNKTSVFFTSSLRAKNEYLENLIIFGLPWFCDCIVPSSFFDKDSRMTS